MSKHGDTSAPAVALRAGAASAWQGELADAIDDAAELLAAVGLDARPRHDDAGFPMRVPRGFVARMRAGDPHDPLLRQVLPVAAESTSAPGYTEDPVGDLDSMRSPGLLQKYAGRALLIATGACAIHCRYCFRREFPYGDAALAASRVDEALERIAADATLGEIILSGGDPLSLTNARLARLVHRIGAIEHVRRIRIHTRHPVVLPSRIDAGLVDIVRRAPVPVVVVVHSNHVRELGDRAATALEALRSAAASLLNQSVLLRGVNDSVPALADLSERLFDVGVLPYYLHQLDPVAGAAHFAVPDAEARRIVAELKSRLPGYLVPRLVREIRGEPAKRAL